MEAAQPETAAVVVDEWPLVRTGLTSTLEAAGVAVVAAVASAEEGVRRAGAAGARWVVLGAPGDLSLLDAARRAKALRPAPAVLVLLGPVTGDDLQQLLAAGVEGFLVRSSHPDEVVAAMRRVAGGERAVAPSLLPVLVGMLAPAGEAAGAGDAAPDGPAPGGPAPDGAGAGSGAEAARRLTRKEVQVLGALARGRSNREIADDLFVTPATVKTHLAHIYDKLAVTGRREAVARAVALGLLDAARGPAAGAGEGSG